MSDSNALHTSLIDVSRAFAPPTVSDLTDDDLIAQQRTLAEIGRRVDTAAATVAAEIAHRSRRDLGGEEEAYQEVARRLGVLQNDDNAPGEVLDLSAHRGRMRGVPKKK